VRIIKNEFAKYISADFIDNRFALPPGFAEYIQIMPATYLYNKGWIKFFDAKNILECSDYYLSSYVEDTMVFLEEDNDFKGGIFWVPFGEWSDKHTYYICCDKASPDFGMVVDAHDNNPGCNKDFVNSDYNWNSFMTFIEARDFG